MAADSENEVVRLLNKAGFWDDDAAWRLYGDDPKNFREAETSSRTPTQLS